MMMTLVMIVDVVNTKAMMINVGDNYLIIALFMSDYRL